MAELIIQNPSITSGDFSFSGDAITAIAGHPVAGVGGGGTQSDYVYVPSFNDQTGDITFTLGVTGSEGKGPWHISGDTGPQGNPGVDGISPKVRINDSTNFWEVSYDNGSTWSSTNVSATGQDGQDGEKGNDGVSPTVSFRDITDAEHSNGGTEVTITDANGAHTYSAWNGEDGSMAGAPDIEGNKGISATLDGSTYKVGLSAEFYSAVTSVSSKLDESDFTTYTATTAPGAFQPKGDYLTEVAASGSIIGTGLSTNKIGLVTSAENALTDIVNKVAKPDTTQTDLNNNYLIYSTLTGAGTTTGWMPLSANYYSKSEADGRYQKKEDMSSYLTTAQYETDSAKYVSTGDILTAANNTLTGIKIGSTSYTVPTTDLSDYYTKSETSATGELNTEFAKKLDSTIAASTYQTKDDMSAYLPLSGGTVSGQLVLSAATSTFDQSYLKCINNTNVGNAIFGLGSTGGAIIKTVDGSNNSVQVNVNAGSNNSQLINVKTNNGTTNVGYLIPAMVEQAGWSPSTDDKILHIVLES